MYIWCITLILKKVHYIGCPKVFAWPTGWPWEKSNHWIFKMVKIHQGDCVDDISKEISDGGDWSIQSSFKHGVGHL